MIIGLPKEIKDNENRVGLTPGAVKTLTRRGHRVLVESGAGLGSSIPDEEYRAAARKSSWRPPAPGPPRWWSRSRSRSSRNIGICARI